MRTTAFEFRREGRTLRGLLRLPEGGDPPGGFPVVVQGPGWLGLADAPHYARYHEAFVSHGFAVVVFDHAGFGRSDGDPGWLVPSRQIRDTQAAVAAVTEDGRLDASRVGLFGMGGTGAGNAIAVAARTASVRCVVAYHVVADGADWLRRMRDSRGWDAFLARVTADRARRERGEPGEMVDPRTDLMIAAPERRANASKRDVDAKLPELFHLASADDLLAYRPIDDLGILARPLPLLVATVAGDTVTPEYHALAVFERALAPKRLVRVRGVGHYEADARCFEALAREFTGWFERWLVAAPDRAAASAEARREAEVVEIDAAPVTA